MTKRDVYEVLGVERGASDDDIRRAYLKLAREWHPDKWSSGSDAEKKRAESKFKEISNANEILCDKTKREHYDRFGHDEPLSQVRSQAYASQDGMAAQDIDDILRMFRGAGMGGFTFGGGRGGFRSYSYSTGMGGRRDGQHATGQTHAVPAAAIFYQLLPLLILFMLSWLSMPSESQVPDYSLDQNSYYLFERRTRTGVSYYVDKSFNIDDSRSAETVRQLESRIDGEYRRRLMQFCNVEKMNHEKILRMAQVTGTFYSPDEKSFPSCDEYGKRYGFQTFSGY